MPPRLEILYVEDHTIFADQVIKTLLGDHEVTLVPSLALAREAAAGFGHDLLLVDYDLEDGKGAELVRELRRKGFPGLIVAVSAHDEGNEALIRAGANAVCAKRDMPTLGRVLDDLGF
ncbi:MAG: response regulator [Planctomycetes bacterium]|nr:response regulator [Planctomycetota bacterium]